MLVTSVEDIDGFQTRSVTLLLLQYSIAVQHPRTYSVADVAEKGVDLKEVVFMTRTSPVLLAATLIMSIPLLVQGAGRTQSDTSLPQSSTTLPQSSTTLPQSSTTLPQSSTTLPQSSTTLPQSSTTLPQSSTTLPQSMTTLPQTSTTLPQSSTTLPQSSTTLPQSMTTLPQTSTTLPQSSTTLPQLDPTLPPPCSGITVGTFRCTPGSFDTPSIGSGLR